MPMKEKINDLFDKIRQKVQPRSEWAENPVYSSIIRLKDGTSHRFHLRILRDYTGILTVDASFIVYLNKTAAIYIQQLISGKKIEEIQDYFVDSFQTDKETVTDDFNSILNSIEMLLTQEDVNPVQLGFYDIESFNRVHEIPLRVYLAPTYRFNELNQMAYRQQDVFFTELEISSQKQIIDILSKFGVPQITLSGGEPTLKDGFQELIEYGEGKGIVMGLMTNGTIFHDRDIVKDIILHGLDYVIISIHSHDPSIYKKITGENDIERKIQAITNFEEDDIYLKTKTTLFQQNKDTIEETVAYLNKELKVQNIEVNALINPPNKQIYAYGIDVLEIISIVKKLKLLSEEQNFNFSFTSPTSHPLFNPLDFELGLTSTHPANTSITIEPNGNVLPVQYCFNSPGNILQDDWSKIWNSPLFKQIRKTGIVEKGKESDLLTFCGGGIPFSL